MNKKLSAETILATLVALLTFSILFLSYSSWLKYQTQHIQLNYQQQQALQLIDNQIALKLAGQQCENQVEQNQLHFKINCNDNEIIVQFPLGEIRITAKK